MVLHEHVGVGEFQHALDRGHQARHPEVLVLPGGGRIFPDAEPVHLERVSEVRPLALRQGLEDCFLQIVVEPAGHRDLDGAGPGLVHRHAVALDLPESGRELGRRRGHRVPERRWRIVVRSEQVARAAKLALDRLDVLARLVLLEAHGHQLVRERLRRRAERRLGDAGIRLVEVGDPASLRIGHPEHAAEKLLHVHRAANARDGAEDVGEGTVPSFLERLDGDDVLDRAGAIEEIDAVQLALVAGGDGDPVRRDAFVLRQVRLQRPDRHLLVPRLGLEEDEGPDVVRILLRALGERGAGGDGAAHRALPGVVLGEQDRQLDHRLRLQLPGGDAVQDVAERAAPVVARGGGELDDRARVHPRLHLPGEAGDRVVRLVHDHQRAVDVQQVREGELDPAAVQPFQVRHGVRDAGEVGLQVLVVGRFLKSTRSRARVAGVSRDCSP